MAEESRSVAENNSDSPASTDNSDQTEPTSVSSRYSTSAPRRDVAAASQKSPARFRFLLVAFLLMLSLAGGFAGGWAGSSSRESTASGITGTATTASQQRIAASESQLVASIAKSVGPSVVSVDVTGQSATGNADSSDIYGLFGGGSSNRSRTTQAAGTGIILSTDGIIMTNRHVVPSGTTKVSVTLSDGTELTDVSVVGRSSESDSLDVAFLKVNDLKGKKLTAVELGDSGKVQVGDVVVAIGNALGQFNNTVTSGIISGYGRSVQAGDESGGSVENLNDLFQTDAAINQGNSGGPLVNSAGQVIGMNTAVSGEGQNIGFAIPVNDLSGLIKQVLKTGKFERSYLGVRYIPLTSTIAKQLNLNVSNGAYVQPASDGGENPVISGSPADKAGIKEGDIITKVDGSNIDQTNSLTSLIGRKAVGDGVKLTVLRDGKTTTINATVGAAPTDQ